MNEITDQQGQIIKIEDERAVNVYAKRELVLARGSMATVWDLKGREYIDCTGSYGSCLVGYCHSDVVEAIKGQAEILSSCHGYAYNQARSKLLEKLFNIAPKGVGRIFLSNSGSEAVEAALKIARRYTGRPEAISMVGAYHGKTFGSLSATWNKKYRDPFQPLLKDFKHVPYGKPDKLEEAITENTGAVLVEPIQGESGVKVPPNGFLKEVRRICDEHNILLILDEIQTGLGRTGKMFACEHEGVRPDLLCIAKGLAGGLPIGVTFGRGDVMTSLRRGEHSSTYGGNPIVSAAAAATIDILVRDKLPDRATELGGYLNKRLGEEVGGRRIVREVRGKGLMIGVELRFDVLDVILGAMDRGVLVLDAGRTVIRLLPPLVISKMQIDKAVDVLSDLIEEKEFDHSPD